MELLLHPGPVLGAGRMLNHGDHTAAPRGWQALSLASEPPCNRTLQALWHQGVAAPEIRRAWTPPTVISTPKKKNNPEQAKQNLVGDAFTKAASGPRAAGLQPNYFILFF